MKIYRVLDWVFPIKIVLSNGISSICANYRLVLTNVLFAGGVARDFFLSIAGEFPMLSHRRREAKNGKYDFHLISARDKIFYISVSLKKQFFVRKFSAVTGFYLAFVQFTAGFHITFYLNIKDPIIVNKGTFQQIGIIQISCFPPVDYT